MNAKPVIYDFPVHLPKPGLSGARYLPWFHESMVLAFDFGRWLDSYITKNLPSIDISAQQQGNLFYYHPRDGKLNYLCDEFYTKPDAVFKEFIHYYFFNDQYGPTVTFLRRLDDTRFLAWLTADIVKQDGHIHWPDNLFDNLAGISYISALELENGGNNNEQLVKDRLNADIQLSNPNVSLYNFEKHVYRCHECQSGEAIYIEKRFDFYNIMETEYPCGRCKKESHVVSSGDLIYRWNGDEWHPEVAYIPLASGYCLDCKPYFESMMDDLMVECSNCSCVISLDIN